MTIAEQANLATTYKRMPKLKLVGQALENFLLAEQLNAANQKAGAKINRLIDVLKDANDMCRSAMEIAKRDGKDTNWETFRARLHESLLRQHAVMYLPNDQKERR